MKLSGNFIDCVFEQDMREIGRKLVYKLPDIRICELAGILIFNTPNGMYLVKSRSYEVKEDGKIDIEKTYKKITDSDFVEFSKEDFTERMSKNDIKDWGKIINEMIKPCSNIIFKMNIDVNKLER